jgi:imidazolonepropionase-like amidohydrolase
VTPLRCDTKTGRSILGSAFVPAQLLVALVSCADGTREPAELALVGGTLLDPASATLREGVIVIRGDRLACVGTADECPPPAGARSVDLRGLFIGPGLIDAHVHYGQTGWVDGRPDAIDLRAQYPYDSVAGALQAHP